MNLGAYLDTAVSRYQNETYLQFYDETISYKAFGDRVNVLANSL